MIPTILLFPLQGADERSLEILVGVLEKNNLPGFDYLEFRRAILALQAMSLDEQTAYRGAFATAAAAGLSKEKILESAQYYHHLLDREREVFEAALNHRREREVAARIREIARLKDLIERHRAEIARLQDELGHYLNEVERLEAERQQEEHKLDRAQLAFDQTRQAIMRHIEEDVERFHRYL